MRKNRFLFILGIMFMGIISVKAETCDYAKQVIINAEAANMDFQYEFAKKNIGVGEADGLEVPIIANYAKLYIYNLTENLVVNVTSSLDKKILSFNYDDVKDSVITFDVDDLSEVGTYTFKVLPADSECGKNEVRIYEIKVPKYNDFSEYAMCSETPDFYLCQEFTNVDKTFDDFVVEREQYLLNIKEEEEKIEKENGFIKFLKDYKFIIIGIVAVGGVSGFIVYKKGSNEE